LERIGENIKACISSNALIMVYAVILLVAALAVELVEGGLGIIAVIT
jgi:hypothetical protein